MQTGWSKSIHDIHIILAKISGILPLCQLGYVIYKRRRRISVLSIFTFLGYLFLIGIYVNDEAEILLFKENRDEMSAQARKPVAMRRVTEMVMTEWFMINLTFGIQIWMHPDFDVMKSDYMLNKP